MILAWFVLGIAIIFCIARYNESNKLFWQLLLAFVLGFSVTKMVQQTNNNPKNNVTLVQVSPTQMPIAQTWAIIAYINCVKELNVVTAQSFVGQEYTPVNSESDIIFSKICGRVRDQPRKILTNPPELCSAKDFLILHDYG